MAALTSLPPQGLSSPRFSARLKEGSSGEACVFTPFSSLRGLASTPAESGSGKRSEPHQCLGHLHGLPWPPLRSVLVETPQENTGEPSFLESTLLLERVPRFCCFGFHSLCALYPVPQCPLSHPHNLPLYVSHLFCVVGPKLFH